MLPVLLLILSLVTVGFIFRAFLILVGLLKDPVLRTFEQYGPQERPYLPLLPLLLWIGAALLLVSIWAGRTVVVSFVSGALGTILVILVGIAYNNYDTASRWHVRWLRFPRWYHEIMGRTSRYERRRIAYMWLKLPWRLRLTYNSSDLHFFQWADFVIMATIREEEYDPRAEELLYIRR